MGWYGVYRAIITRDADELVEELSPRRNPNDPVSALMLAVGQMSEGERADALAWVLELLSERRNDRRRYAVSLAERVLSDWLSAR